MKKYLVDFIRAFFLVATSGNSFYGLAVGFVVFVGAMSGGAICGSTSLPPSRAARQRPMRSSS